MNVYEISISDVRYGIAAKTAIEALLTLVTTIDLPFADLAIEDDIKQINPAEFDKIMIDDEENEGESLTITQMLEGLQESDMLYCSEN